MKKELYAQEVKPIIPKMFQLVSCVIDNISWKFYENTLIDFTVSGQSCIEATLKNIDILQIKKKQNKTIKILSGPFYINLCRLTPSSTSRQKSQKMSVMLVSALVFISRLGK